MDLDIVVGLKLFKQAPYLVMTNHMCFPAVILASKKWWDRLSADDRAMIKKIFQDATDYAISEQARVEGENLATLKKQGVKVQEVDLAVLKQAAAKVQNLIALLVALIILAILVLLSYHSIIWVADPMGHTELTETTGIPKWYLYSIMPAAMLAMTFHYVVYVLGVYLGRAGRWQMITALLFFTALFIGMPIVFLLIFGTLVSIHEPNMDLLLPIVPQQIFRSFEKAGLLAIPMFMLVGELMNLADLFVGRFRVGLAYVNLLTNTLASAILGSATAQIAMMCRVMVKPMTDRGYDKGYSTGLTIASGMLGPIIPPSMVLIIYAIIAYQSAAALFMAGVFTGLVVAGGFGLTIFILGFFYEYPAVEKRPADAPRPGVVILQGSLPLSIPVVITAGVVT